MPTTNVLLVLDTEQFTVTAFVDDQKIGEAVLEGEELLFPNLEEQIKQRRATESGKPSS